MSSKIEQIIDEIQEYIDSCKYQPLSNTKIVVSKDEMDELLRELRMKTPEEIRRYQKIISNRDAIMEDAKTKAEAMLREATIQTNELVNEHEIMQQAYAQANEIIAQATQKAQMILDNATKDANEIRIGAIQYTDEMLGSLHNIVSHAIDSASAKYDNLILDLKRTCDIIDTNRASLSATDEQGGTEETAKDAETLEEEEQ